MDSLWIIGQEQQRLSLKKDTPLSSILNQINRGSTKISFDQDIYCKNSPSSIQIHYSDDKELLEKLSCFCHLDIIHLEKEHFLIKNTTTTDSFYIFSLKEKDNSQPLAFASFKILPSNKSFVSDLGGYVFVRLKNNEKIETIIIQSLSYGEKTIDYTSLNGETIFLEPKIFKLPTIVHKKSHLNVLKDTRGRIELLKETKNNGITFSQFTNTPGALSMLFPGMQWVRDKGGSTRIRNTESASVLLSLDGMTIYRADHFFGIFSAMNPDYIDKITIHRNNIPIEYGGRSAGMLEYNSPTEAEKSYINIQSNLLYSGVSSHIKFSDNFGLMAAGRITYVNLLQTDYFNPKERLDILSQTFGSTNTNVTSRPDFNFFDYNLKAYYRHKNREITLSHFKSSDRFYDNYNLQFRTREGINTLNIYDRVEQWNNETYQMSYVQKWENLRWRTELNHIQYNNNQDLALRLRERDLNNPMGIIQRFNNDNFINDWAVKSYFENDKNKKMKFLAGIESIVHDNGLNIVALNNSIFENITTPWEHNAFGQMELTTSNFWMIRTSMRTTYIPSVEKVLFQPQLYIQKFLNSQLKIKSSLNRQNQLMRQFMYETPTGLMRDFFAFTNDSSIPIGQANNGMIGLKWQNENTGWHWDVELFYNAMEGALNYATRQVGIIRRDQTVVFSDFNLFQGQSRRYGGEVVLSYHKNSFTGLVQYRMSQSEQRYERIFNNVWHVAPDDSRHQLSTVIAQSFRGFMVSLSYAGNTGLPYQDLVKIRNIRDRRLISPENVISRLPDFHRVDFGLQYNFKISSKPFTLGFHVYNIFNRINVAQRQFLSQLSTTNNQTWDIESDVLQLGRVYNLGGSVRF